MKEGPNVLFPMLLPFQFTWSKGEAVIWKDGQCSFEIVSFSVRGRETNGYRILYKGAAESFPKLLNKFLGTFELSFSGIEWVADTEHSQSELIRLAEQNQFTYCSMYGLYEYQDVGIVLMPNSQVHLQIRNQRITSRNVLAHMQKIEGISTRFSRQPLDLFSVMEGVEYA